MIEPRGFRNNNPGNIRKGPSAWVGKVAGTDTAFETFAPGPVGYPRMAYGIRALWVLLRNYIAGGFNTVSSIITRYAPGNENDTAAYIASVSSRMGVSPSQVLNMRDHGDKLVEAIIYHENGRAVSLGDIARSATLA